MVYHDEFAVSKTKIRSKLVTHWMVYDQRIAAIASRSRNRGIECIDITKIASSSSNHSIEPINITAIASSSSNRSIERIESPQSPAVAATAASNVSTHRNRLQWRKPQHRTYWITAIASSSSNHSIERIKSPQSPTVAATAASNLSISLQTC